MSDGLTMRILSSQVHFESIDERFERFDVTKSSDVVNKHGSLLRVDYECIDGEIAGVSHDGYR